MTKNRLEAFSDGVFAIVITLLILNIKLPSVPASQLLSALLRIWPNLLAFVLSFLIVGVYWVAHHQMYQFIRRVDRNLLWLNNISLLLIAFLPFPTELLGSYPTSRVAIVLYGACLILINSSGTLVWLYATGRHRLVDPELPRGFIRLIAWIHISPAIAYAAALALSLFDPRIPMVVFFLVPLFFILPNPWLNRHVQMVRER